MTKTEYREYLQSEAWQQRRKEFLLMNDFCVRCSMPRWLAAIAYDQDLHVHHRNYANVGHEPDEDLQPLCRRCHDIATFGRSDLTAPKSVTCKGCWRTHFNPYSEYCHNCFILNDPEESELFLESYRWNQKIGEDVTLAHKAIHHILGDLCLELFFKYERKLSHEQIDRLAEDRLLTIITEVIEATR